jgi:hypothetical protein
MALEGEGEGLNRCARGNEKTGYGRFFHASFATM